MKKALLRTFLLLALSTAGAGLCLGEDLGLRFTGYTYGNGRIYSDVSLGGDISYDTIDAIRNGITANIFVTVQLMKTGGLFTSGREIVAQRTFTYRISYDVWENRFVLNDKAKKREHQVALASDIVRELSAAVSPLALALAKPERDDKYMIRAKIKIQTIKLYPPFGIFLYFFDPWNYESGWMYSGSFSIEDGAVAPAERT
jgi:hypothetical protein